MSDNRLFKTEYDVVNFFLSVSRPDVNHLEQIKKEKGNMIDTKLRKEILTGSNAGKITINGIVEEFIFKNLTGGVYHCTVTDFYKTVKKPFSDKK